MNETPDRPQSTDDNPVGANCTEHLDVYRERCQQLTCRITELSSALAALIARVRRTGGYASPEEQEVLRQVERALAGVPGKGHPAGVAETGPRMAQERAESPGCSDTAPSVSELTTALLAACDLGETLRDPDDPRLTSEEHEWWAAWWAELRRTAGGGR